jgi:hypothetical protein
MIQIDREQTIRAGKQAAGPGKSTQYRHGKYYGQTHGSDPVG